MIPETITDFSDLTLPSKIKLVLLDLDNTLFAYDPCHTAGLDVVKKRLTKENILSESDFTDRYKEAQKVVKSRIDQFGASHSRLLYFYEMLHALSHPSASNLALELEEMYWETFKSNMVLTDGALSFLQCCQENDTPIVILTDLTTRIQFEKLSALGISEYITYVLTSEAIGVEKPGAKIFTTALEKYATEASNAIVIGDDYKKDIVGANNLGINTILIEHETITADSPLR